MDRYDIKILEILQDKGRIPFTQLGKMVGLTTTPCIERVKKLERKGYIEGYSARLNAKKLNAGIVVFVQISLDRSSKKNFEIFRRNIQKVEQVQECYLVTGSFDFLVKARVSDMEAYRNLLETKLLDIPGVQNSASITVMNTEKETLAISINNNKTNLLP